MAPEKTRVLILGCGFAGSTVAARLADKAKKKAEIQVIERKLSFQLPASFQWVMMGWKKPSEVERSLRPISRKGVEIINDTVEKIDVKRRTVNTSTDDYPYDHLVVALGAEYATNLVPGLEEYSHYTYDLGHAVKFRDAVKSFQGGKMLIGISRLPFKCPPAPYEVALLLQQHFQSTGRKTTVEIFTPEALPLPAAGPVIGRQMIKMLESRKIAYHPKSIVKRLERDRAVFEDGQEMNFDLSYTVPPHVCPKPLVDAGLTDSSGWVPVNPQTLTTKYENVYALGDSASVQTAHGHVPFLPKAGIFARGQAMVLADNLANSINEASASDTTVWDGTGYCYLATGMEEAAFLQGSFLSNPPKLEFHMPSQKWYVDRLAFEKEMLHGKFSGPSIKA